MFVRKMREFNVDEIDDRPPLLFSLGPDAIHTLQRKKKAMN